MSPLKTQVSFAIIFTGALLAGSACQAQDATSACGSVTSLQRRIVEHADEGIESLRSFVWTARVTHGIGMRDVKVGLDGWRNTVACQKEAAATAAAAAVAKAEAPAPAQPASADQVVAANR